MAVGASMHLVLARFLSSPLPGIGMTFIPLVNNAKCMQLTVMEEPT